MNKKFPKSQSFDQRRDLVILPNKEEAIRFAAKHWIQRANQAINRQGRCAVALSGGTTPAPIYHLLTHSPYKEQVDWSKILLFWSDERAVPPTHPESNYRMAMESGFDHVPIPQNQIFRMIAERESAALEYEQLIQTHLGPKLFDMILLGVGFDGHTASLFPNSPALTPSNHLVTSLTIGEKRRMTLTLECINNSQSAIFYVFGSAKQTIVRDVLTAPSPSPYPASCVGTLKNKALWILDAAAAASLPSF